MEPLVESPLEPHGIFCRASCEFSSGGCCGISAEPLYEPRVEALWKLLWSLFCGVFVEPPLEAPLAAPLELLFEASVIIQCYSNLMSAILQLYLSNAAMLDQ